MKFYSLLKSENHLGVRFHFSLLSKLLLSFLLVILLPFVVFTYIASYNSNQITKKNISSDAINNLSYFSHLMDKKLYTMEYLMNYIFSDRDIENFNYELNIKSADKSKKIPNTAKYSSQFVNIGDEDIWKYCNIYILNPKDCYNLYVRNYYQNIDPEALSESWYKKIYSQPKSYLLMGTNLRKYLNGDKRFVISSAKYFRDAGFEYSNLILIDYDYSLIIKSIYEKTQQLEYLDNNLIVIDSNKNIMYCNDSNMLTSKLDYDFIDKISKNSSGSLRVNMNNESYYLTYYTSPFNSWKYIAFIPMSRLNVSMNRNNIVNVVLTLFLFILVSFFAYLSSSIILKPLNKLLKSMSELKKGNFSERITIKRKDETSILAERFNEMASDLEDMISKVYLSEIKRKDAELLSLQSQINPHFLYNTLDSIRGSAVSINASDIAAMSKSLALMLRYSINDNMVVSINDEIHHVQNYLKIQNFRFYDRFKMNITQNTDLHDCSILRLTLQPIVENCIKHGFSSSIDEGLITLSFYKADDIIKISISDNGIGLSNKRIAELNNILNDAPNSHGKYFSLNKTDNGKGLKNVNIRIKLFYGSEYGIHFLEAVKGTAVEIIIPYIKKEDKNEAVDC